MGIFSKLFGSYSTRELARIEPIKQKVQALDEEYTALSDAELKGKTQEFRDRLESGETLDSMMAEALATVREAAYRVLGKKPFPVQIIGAIVLHQGRIAEMKTGEGKTLVACVASYLNALPGKGVHVVTVKDYLAKTQSDEMGKVLRFLGLTVGCILHGLTNDQRREAYACDVTYGTNNELGFDYLRDNMVIYKKDKVQREHNFAIVDVVDSILIVEARTPLIISGRGDKSTSLYGVVDKFAKTLTPTMVVEMDSKQDQEDTNENADYIIDVVQQGQVFRCHQVINCKIIFCFLDTTTGNGCSLCLFINDVIGIFIGIFLILLLSISTTMVGVKVFANLSTTPYREVDLSPRPEIINGVLASSIKMAKLSSLMNLLVVRCWADGLMMVCIRQSKQRKA